MKNGICKLGSSSPVHRFVSALMQDARSRKFLDPSIIPTAPEDEKVSDQALFSPTKSDQKGIFKYPGPGRAQTVQPASPAESVRFPYSRVQDLPLSLAFAFAAEAA